MKKVVLGIIILLISFIALILIIEGTYYIYMLFLGKTQHNSNVIDFSISDLFAPDEKAGYILKPNASTTHLPDWEHQREIYDKHSPGAGKRISTNSAGYRGKLYDVSKDENTTRLLVLGGSTTWGPYNDDGSTWPDYLEEMLQEKYTHKQIQVINAAVGGYNTAHNLEMVKQKYQFYNPDIVLIACWFNDMYIMGHGYLYGLPSPHMDYHVEIRNSALDKNKEATTFKGCRFLYQRFLVLRGYLRLYLTTTKEYRDLLSNPTKSFFKRYYANDKIWIQDYLSNVGKIISTFKSRNPKVEIFIVAMPSFFAPATQEDFKEKPNLPNYDITLYNRSYSARRVDSRFLFTVYLYHTVLFQEFLSKKSDEFGFRLIPGYPALGKIPVEERYEYFTDEMHLTDKGNLLLANEISVRLQTLSNNLKSNNN